MPLRTWKRILQKNKKTAPGVAAPAAADANMTRTSTVIQALCALIVPYQGPGRKRKGEKS